MSLGNVLDRKHVVHIGDMHMTDMYILAIILILHVVHWYSRKTTISHILCFIYALLLNTCAVSSPAKPYKNLKLSLPITCNSHKMKSTLRCFNPPKHILPLLKPTHSLSRRFPQNSRQIHSVNPRLCSEPDSSLPPKTQNPPRLWSIYDPVIAGLVTKTTVNVSEEAREPEPASAPESSVGDDLERERINGKLRSQSSGDLEQPHVKKKPSLGVRDIVGNKKRGRGNRVNWVCADCGHTDGQWWGTCRSCESVGTMKKFSEGESGNGHVVERAWLPQKPEQVQPMRLRDVNRGINQLNWRIPM